MVNTIFAEKLLSNHQKDIAPIPHANHRTKNNLLRIREYSKFLAELYVALLNKSQVDIG